MPLSKLQGLNAAEATELVAYRLRARLREAGDRWGGAARLARRSEQWAAEWRASEGADGIAAWLSRPGAGAFWFEPDATSWARETCTDDDVALAARAASGEFELLGAGPVRLGDPPAWRRDLYTGVEWPLEPSSRLRIARGDGSDIRTVWELSRGYHLLAFARAWTRTGERAYADAFAAHVSSFSEQNPPGLGPHWASPMDVAIRAANWSACVPLFAGAPLPAEFWARLLADLWLAGRYVERHLEWHPVYRGNHFVANAVGLVYLGTLFRGSADGDRWLAAGSAHLQREIMYQVCDDGVSFEASLAYHRLVTELFAYGGELLRRNDPSFDAAAYDRRLERMHAFIGAYLQPDGRAPMIGDADDGRLHALSAASLGEPRRHALGLPPRFAIEAPGDGAHAFPLGGFFVLRHGTDHAVVRCGPVGLRGAGSHDHNDQLSFELVLGGRRVVADSGTYAYTRDLSARHAFRSVAAHSAVQLGGEEPNPIDERLPWRVLADRTRSRALRCDDDGRRLVFVGEHSAYAHRASGAVCRRELSRDHVAGTWSVLDEIDGRGTEDVTWRLQLASDNVVLTDPGDAGTAGTERARAVGAGAVFELEYPAGMRCEVRPTEGSDAYGVAERRAAIVVRGTIELPARITCRIAAAEGVDGAD
jgi:hypothetical protein